MACLSFHEEITKVKRQHPKILKAVEKNRWPATHIGFYPSNRKTVSTDYMKQKQNKDLYPSELLH